VIFYDVFMHLLVYVPHPPHIHTHLAYFIWNICIFCIVWLCRKLCQAW